jgi:oligogalacturonide lyase
LGASVAWAQSASKKASSAPAQGEIVRFSDPVTETVVARLTDPRTNSRLPAPQNRFVSARNHYLLFSSDRGGQMAPFQLDLRNGGVRQLAHPERLDPISLCMDSRERYLYFLDGQSLHEVALNNLKQRTIAEGITEFSMSASGADLMVVKQGRVERLTAGKATPVAENAKGAMARPGGIGCVFWRDQDVRDAEFWYAPFAPQQEKPKLLASGSVNNPVWAPRGESLLYLRQILIPAGDPGGEPIRTAEIHEVIPESGVEQRIAPTSQFAAFAPNSNGTVFVGASRSKAQPTVLLLLRATGREFTLCEHKSTDATAVSPVFSPNSQRVYFQSNREGKWALYSVNTEKLIESTDI